MLPRVGASQESDMGLLDILNSIQAGGVSDDPRARGAPASQGMSPMAKALLALLAVYAVKNLRRADAPPTQPAGPVGGNVSAGLPGGQGGTLGGGLGDLLRGTLGGVLGGAAAGTVLNGGLDNLLKQLQQGGQGDVARSWVGTGPNKAISQRERARNRHARPVVGADRDGSRRFAIRAEPASAALRRPTHAGRPAADGGGSRADGLVASADAPFAFALRHAAAPLQQRQVEPVGVGAARGHEQSLLRDQHGTAEKVRALAERARKVSRYERKIRLAREKCAHLIAVFLGK